MKKYRFYLCSSVVAMLLFSSPAPAGSPVYGRGAGSGSDVHGRMLKNSSVYGRQQEATVYRGGMTYDEVVLSTSGLVAYWPLDGTLTELVSGNTASGTNTWTAGLHHTQAAQMNGTSNYLESTSAIDLTGTSAATVVMDWYPTVYDTTNEKVMLSFGAMAGLTTGFSINTQGNVANDPLAAQVKGDVNYNYSRYNAATFGFSTPGWFRLAATFDKTQTTNETDLYINASLATASSRVTNNNANAFGNLKLAVGSYFGSLYVNHAFEGVALYNRALTAKQIQEINATW